MIGLFLVILIGHFASHLINHLNNNIPFSFLTISLFLGLSFHIFLHNLSLSLTFALASLFLSLFPSFFPHSLLLFFFLGHFNNLPQQTLLCGPLEVLHNLCLIVQQLVLDDLLAQNLFFHFSNKLSGLTFTGLLHQFFLSSTLFLDLICLHILSSANIDNHLICLLYFLSHFFFLNHLRLHFPCGLSDGLSGDFSGGHSLSSDHFHDFHGLLALIFLNWRLFGDFLDILNTLSFLNILHFLNTLSFLHSSYAAFVLWLFCGFD